MLLYNGGQSSGSGDFISVNIVNGFLVLSYDLGSGVARISSLRLVPLPSPRRLFTKSTHTEQSLQH